MALPPGTAFIIHQKNFVFIPTFSQKNRTFVALLSHLIFKKYSAVLDVYIVLLYIEKNKKYGILLTPDIKLHREYFKQMVKLLGIQVVYRAPKPSKHWTNFTEVEANYQLPEVVGCIFDEHPTQKTMKKLGWDSELQTEESIISVPYDLHDIQIGALFIVPSGLDNTKGRLFRVTELSVGMIYPASVTCRLVPEWEDSYGPKEQDYRHSSFNLLNDEKIELK